MLEPEIYELTTFTLCIVFQLEPSLNANILYRL